MSSADTLCLVGPMASQLESQGGSSLVEKFEKSEEFEKSEMFEKFEQFEQFALSTHFAL